MLDHNGVVLVIVRGHPALPILQPPGHHLGFIGYLGHIAVARPTGPQNRGRRGAVAVVEERPRLKAPLPALKIPLQKGDRQRTVLMDMALRLLEELRIQGVIRVLAVQEQLHPGRVEGHLGLEARQLLVQLQAVPAREVVLLPQLRQVLHGRHGRGGALDVTPGLRVPLPGQLRSGLGLLRLRQLRPPAGLRLHGRRC